jgi:hypothetical protein
VKQPTVDRVFTAHAAGVATMPTEILTAHAAVHRVEQLRADLKVTAPTVAADDRLGALAGLLVDCAADDDIDLTALDADLRAHRQADADHQARSAIITRAHELAQRRLEDAITNHADAIIRDHLAPALDATVTALRKARDTYRGHGDSDRELLNAPAPARAAWLTADRLVTTYTILRLTRVHVLRAIGRGEGGHDSRGLFAEMRNTEHVWPAIVTHPGIVYSGQQPPWDAPDAHGRLVKLIDLGAEFWCPTHEEQESRWLEVFGPSLDRDPHRMLTEQTRTATRTAVGIA